MNLQNIPSSDDYRNAFYVDEGMTICDYSSMEIRRVAEVANETALIKALNEGLDPHRDTAERTWGKEYINMLFTTDEKQFKKYRSIAKCLNFSTLYGVSAFKLSKDFNVTQAEAQKWIDDWFKANPNIRDWLAKVRAKALEKGYVVIDKLGRKAYFKDWPRYIQIRDFLNTLRNNRQEHLVDESVLKGLRRELMIIKGRIERQAGNFLIQGSCASVTKTAQILAWKRGLKNLLQVHDELLIVGNHPEELKSCMEEAWNFFNIKVQMPLVSEYSPYWKK